MTPMTGASSTNRRDRDPEGRARNLRPRDELGRPLPYGSDGVPRQPEGVLRTPDETIAEAQRLLDAGLPFHAHEVFEDAWKSGNSADRSLWKGLAQLAVGLTHLARNNRTGARALLSRGSQAIVPYNRDAAYGIDIGGLVSWADQVIRQLDGDQSLAVPLLVLRPS
jgi:hypothetical protein